jgi:hypothetical protein
MNSSVLLRCFLSLVLLFLFSFQGIAQANSCEQIQVKVTVVHSTEGKDNGQIHLSFEKDTRFFNIHLLKTSKDYKLNLNKTDIENLKKGNYTIVVTGKDEKSPYCPKQLEVIVQ